MSIPMYLWTATPLAFGLCLLAFIALHRAAQPLALTTLGSAHAWAMLAMIACGLSSTVQTLTAPSFDNIAGHCWYWTSILLICPFISVLGSRRPTNRVWNWFIILPLVCVLGWPAVAVLARFPNLHPLEIQTPVVWGFSLTLVMGVGNYLSTRFAMAAVLGGFASLAALIPVTAFHPQWWPSPDWQLPTILASLAVLLASRQALRPLRATSPEDAVWFDFQETFGLVWSVRICERVNAAALRGNWPVRLDMDGFHWSEGGSSQDREATLPSLHQTLRWLLRRFVDAPWIDRHLGQEK